MKGSFYNGFQLNTHSVGKCAVQTSVQNIVCSRDGNVQAESKKPSSNLQSCEFFKLSAPKCFEKTNSFKESPQGNNWPTKKMFFRFSDRTYILAYEITDHNLCFEVFCEESLRTFSYPVCQFVVRRKTYLGIIVATEVCLK